MPADSSLFDSALLQTFKSSLTDKTPMYFYNYGSIMKQAKKSSFDLTKTILSMCQDGINAGYAEGSVKNLNDLPLVFDLLMIFAVPLERIRTQTDINNNVLAILIAQNGECSERSIQRDEVYSINLICSDCKKGGTAMACFLYCIIKHENMYPLEAVLELAGGYTNVGGYCMYTKFGFVTDETMAVKDCFPDIGNLPMYCNFQQFGNDDDEMAAKVIAILNGQASLKKAELCTIRPANRQMLAAMTLNLERYAKAGTIDDHREFLYLELFYRILGYYKITPTIDVDGYLEVRPENVTDIADFYVAITDTDMKYRMPDADVDWFIKRVYNPKPEKPEDQRPSCGKIPPAPFVEAPPALQLPTNNDNKGWLGNYSPAASPTLTPTAASPTIFGRLQNKVQRGITGIRRMRDELDLMPDADYARNVRPRGGRRGRNRTHKRRQKRSVH